MYYVYIASNKNLSVFYTGVTNNITRRMHEHKNGLTDGFTKKYNVNRLIYCESFNQINEAIAAEKIIKGWTRKKKVSLIKKQNPWLKDLLND